MRGSSVKTILIAYDLLLNEYTFYIVRLLDILMEKLQRFQIGEPLINVVDKRLGY